MVDDNGLNVINEMPDVKTMLRGHVLDLDVKGAYPNTEDFMNLSKETTYRELCRIRGIDETVQRKAGINLTAARTNAVEICCTVLKAPTFDTLLEEFEKDISEGEV